jgi:hypothetical protein
VSQERNSAVKNLSYWGLETVASSLLTTYMKPNFIYKREKVMRQKKVLLGAIIIAGSCVGIAPSWSQTSPQTRPGDNPVADKQAEQQGDKQKMSEKGKSGQESSMRQSSGESSKMGGRMAQSDVKKIQEALRDKGTDPGAIDGMMGPKTREAIKSFQAANNIKTTGMIDAETAKQLGVDQSQPSSMRR